MTFLPEITVGALTASQDNGSTGNAQVESGQIIPTTWSIRTEQTGGNGWGVQEEATPTLNTSTEGGVAIATAAAVRRLTPIECERLQGFPDGWTAGHADSTRYRMLGNAVCVPVAHWIGVRITNVSEAA